MKFAQYLRDTQTPEWKKAYIDYRGLKKRITVIRKSQQGLNFHVIPSDDSPDELPSPPAAPRGSDVGSKFSRQTFDAPRNSMETTGSTHSQSTNLAHIPELQTEGRETSEGSKASPVIARSRPSFSVSLRRGRKISLSGRSGHQDDPLAILPLHDLLTKLTPQEVSFFIMLDAQLDKVESFYLTKEKEMLARGYVLRMQLAELQGHRKLFHEAQSTVHWTFNAFSNLKMKLGLQPAGVIEPPSRIQKFKGKASQPIVNFENLAEVNKEVALQSPTDEVEETGCSTSVLNATLAANSKGKRTSSATSQNADSDQADDEDEERESAEFPPLSADPDSYLYAKRKLKKAVLEHYRGLEVLHNYRVLNITGFRKALKKFEKVTKIPVQQQYMSEKVEKSAFASDKAVRQMMAEMEELYATAFARGDKKRATKRLRVGNSSKSHHFSAFRSGAYVGIALPALVDGLVKVFQQETRQKIPVWGALLYIYGSFLIPVFFTFLVGINLLVWANARINYVFIFELNVLTQLDHRQFFETPSILLAALCYAFWLSFTIVDSPHISPTIWPLVWLGLVAVVVFDPLPLLYRSSRYWLIKNVGKLFVSGMRPVEFTDFWMGDQFCSLTLTLSNLYFFVCVYVDDFGPDWQKCRVSSSNWPVYFILASLPLFIRLVQSIKRYADSKLITHLINGGKYASGIITALFFYLWRRHQDGRGTIFAFWVLTNVCYSAYACAWDFLMDWSFFRMHSQNPLLRPELVYTNQLPMYYFAMITNLIIRFVWVVYIPKSGPNMMVRTFFVGFLEMLRRWQWNFYRLENEHLGNMDQYRVTREVPLPYAFNDRSREDDTDDDDHLKIRR